MQVLKLLTIFSLAYFTGYSFAVELSKTPVQNTGTQQYKIGGSSK